MYKKKHIFEHDHERSRNGNPVIATPAAPQTRGMDAPSSQVRGSTRRRQTITSSSSREFLMKTEKPLRLHCRWQWSRGLLCRPVRCSKRLQASSHPRESAPRMGRRKWLFHSGGHQDGSRRSWGLTTHSVECNAKNRIYNRHGSVHASGLRRRHSATVGQPLGCCTR